jgi:hypothetical protein
MSPLQRGVLRELVLFQAAQAQLRLLQPAQGGERHGTTGGNRLLAVQIARKFISELVFCVYFCKHQRHQLSNPSSL